MSTAPCWGHLYLNRIWTGALCLMRVLNGVAKFFASPFHAFKAAWSTIIHKWMLRLGTTRAFDFCWPNWCSRHNNPQSSVWSLAVFKNSRCQNGLLSTFYSKPNQRSSSKHSKITTIFHTTVLCTSRTRRSCPVARRSEGKCAAMSLQRP